MPKMQTFNLKNVRQSNFELLRLLSMFLIIWYHLSMGFIASHSEYAIWQSSWIVLHIGVVCFVLISGYFGIRISISGLLRLLGVFFVYCLPEIVYGCYHAETMADISHSCRFITQSDYWFVRTYIALYVLSPLLNKYNEHSSFRGEMYMLLVLGLISVGVGNMGKYTLYIDGKNVINFMFLYQLGHILNKTKTEWMKFPGWKVLIVYICVNALLIALYICMHGTYWGRALWHLSFPYNSPLLIINAVLVFMMFGKMQFSSKTINRMAGGVFATYLIHANVHVEPFLNYVTDIVYKYLGSNSIIIALWLPIFTLVILLLCLLVNYGLSPIWMLLGRFAKYVELHINEYNINNNR